MGVPTSEVGYTSAMPRREGHEVHKDMWGIGGKIFASCGTFIDTENHCFVYVALSFLTLYAK